jgi:hypothetical protein
MSEVVVVMVVVVAMMKMMGAQAAGKRILRTSSSLPTISTSDTVIIYHIGSLSHSAGREADADVARFAAPRGLQRWQR